MVQNNARRREAQRQALAKKRSTSVRNISDADLDAAVRAGVIDSVTSTSWSSCDTDSSHSSSSSHDSSSSHSSSSHDSGSSSCDSGGGGW